MRYSVWIDRGGTFTDCILRDGDSYRVAKVLSSADAPIEGIRQLLGLTDEDIIPPCDLRLGTTLATNALLERRGAKTALVITRGFRDALVIGDQSRPKLFALQIDKPAALYGAVLETDARVGGGRTRRGNAGELEPELRALRARGFESVAVVVLRGHEEPTVEEEIGAIARRVGFQEVSLSSSVPELGLVARGDTAVADAYLTPVLARYVADLSAKLPGSRVRAMQSSGTLTDAAGFRGRNAVLSGPAGGIVALAHIARLMGEAQVIGFDMGGTSTDVSRVAGEPERSYETHVAGVRLRTPMLRMHTIAAGGGSLCRARGGRLTVGPESAGADPGPLCYGRIGASELSLTDINLALGRVLPHRFPFPLDRAAVMAPLEALARDLARRTGGEHTALSVAGGFFEVAVEAMASAIRTVTVARGHDARDHALVVFGGAGGQTACAVARRLGIRRLIFHPLAGVLSAYGMGVAPIGWHGEEDLGRLLVGADLRAVADEPLAALEARGRAALEAEGYRGDDVEIRRFVDLRYRGTETALSLDVDPLREAAPDGGGGLRGRFDEAHAREFGYARPGHPVEATTARVSVSSVVSEGLTADVPPPARLAPLPDTAAATLAGRRSPREVPVVAREDLRPGDTQPGPLIVVEATGTIVVEEGFVLEVLAGGMLRLEDQGAPLCIPVPEADATTPDPVRLEVMANRFAAIAEQMGEVLRRTALSTNIRDRLDYSCAVFDAEGALVANAPHIPVHLGAMGESVRAVFEAHPAPDPGDVFVTNDPAAGGSHLPDITVVTPVHDAAGELLFFTANRGHHADIGGISPGSMPAFSSTLAEEGVRFRAERVVRRGRLEREWFLRRLHQGPHPARRPEDNLADLEAQIAANRKGAALLGELVVERGAAFVAAYMGHVQDDAAAQVAAAIAELPDGRRKFEDALDDGTPIVVTVDISGSRLAIDFEGTGPALRSNLNAPRAVTIAAVLYSLRCLVSAPIPLNAGCLRPVSIRIPRGSVLDPPAGAAVAGGNVETSQRIVDVLLGALDRAAASQGTMNNLTFGNDSFGYYETLGGGAGAGPGFPGASGVHTHMTNSRITDAEVLETRYPVRVREFSLREGSGGRGRYRGGDGLVRELEALAPLTVSILSQRRRRPPFGLAGGEAAACGKNVIAGEDVGPVAEKQVAAGQVFRIETPGGGGYGAPES